MVGDNLPLSLDLVPCIFIDSVHILSVVMNLMTVSKRRMCFPKLLIYVENFSNYSENFFNREEIEYEILQELFIFRRTRDFRFTQFTLAFF